jgi:hypothetical protein
LGKSPHATYTLDVNGTLNATSILMGGSTISGRKWTTATDAARIFYNTGNVGIGTNNPTVKLHIINSSTALNPDAGITGLYVYNPTNLAGKNSVITNRIGGSAAGRVVYSFDVSGSYGYSIKMDGNSSALKFNNNWEGAGTDTMTLFTNGEAVISGSKFVIKGSNGAAGDPTLHLRHANNRTVFIHNNSDLLYFLSGAADGTDTQDNWGTVANNRWSLTLNLNNNNVTFGGDVNAISLTSAGSIYTTTTIQTSGAFWFPNNLWNKSNDSKNRIFFAANDTTYIRGYTLNGSRNITF